MEFRHTMVYLMGAFAVFFTGCSLGSVQSTSTRFFTLTPISVSSETEAPKKDEVVGIGPVVLAEYLDRPQIVTRVSPHELKTSEFSQWAEPLKSNIARVIRENVSMLTGSEHIFSFPWRRSLQLDYQVMLNVLQFDAASNGPVTLVVQWAVYGENGKGLLVNRRATIESPVSGTGYDAIARAMSIALEDLSREIVGGIRDVKTGI